VTEGPHPPTDVLIVGWYPAADAITSGRFIADQAAALAATGRVRPSVVAFENATIRGPGWLRERQAEAVGSNVATGLRVFPAFAEEGAAGSPSIPVARLAVANGRTPRTGPEHRYIHETTAIKALLEATAGRRWNIVHGHVGYPEGAAAAAAAERLGAPLVITEHASFLGPLLADPVVRDRYRRTLLAADRVVAVSTMLATEVAEIVPELIGRIVVIPNAVAIDEFAGEPAAPRISGELLFVGGRVASKGIETLVRAFAIVHRDRPETTMRLIGPPAPRSGDGPWRELAAELGAAHAVVFEDAADRQAVAAAMARADLFVHPSPRETFGVVAVEALASGLPVVATASGGVEEVLGDDPGPFGAIVPPNDPAALAAAIVTTLDRRASFSARQMRAHVAERFGADRVAGRLAALYDEVGADRRHRQTAASPHALPPLDARSNLPSRTIVVGFPRLELDRAIARFPPGMLARDTLVTSGDAMPGRPDVRAASPSIARSLDELTGWGTRSTALRARVGRRLRRAVGRILTPLADPSVRLADRVLADLSVTLEAELQENPSEAPPLIVCLTGIDHLVAAPFVAAGRAMTTPGGLRWLADVRARPGSSTAPPSEPAPG